MEQHRRTLIKTITWRIIAVVITILVVYIYNKDIEAALKIGISANVIKMGLYYIHERVWNAIKFGKIEPPEYQI